MVKVVVTYKPNAEIVNNENKHDGEPFVAPKSWRGSRFVVSIVVKACAELFIGQLARLGGPVASLDNIEVYPSIMCIWGEIIFVYKLLWNVFKADLDKF